MSFCGRVVNSNLSQPFMEIIPHYILMYADLIIALVLML